MNSSNLLYFISSSEYSHLLLISVLSLVIALVIVGASYILAIQSLYQEKATVYECGFTEFSFGRTTFEIRFFRVAILFIIMDLEVMYIFPWTTNIVDNYGIMILFLFILIVGLLYEWLERGLDWS